ncbi:MAG TPA: Hint domain-containing protein, partial [Acidiphilium sp.]
VAGALSVAGGYDLAGDFDLPGLSGTALDIGSGGFVLFDANAVATLGGAAIVGDTAGAGTLGVAGTLLAPGQTVSVGGASAGGSRFEVTGTVEGGDLVVGTAAPAIADIAGVIGFSATTLGASGTLNATGTASLALGALDIVAGTLDLADSARASAASATLAGGAITLADQASFAVSQSLDLTDGTVSIWQEASLTAGSITIGAGATLAGAGTIDAPVAVSDTLEAGTLEAEAGALVLDGDLTGSATIAAGAALTLAGSVSGGTIGFAGTDALLTLDDPAAMQDAVANFAAGDAIDLIGVAPSLVSVANRTVSIADPGSFALSTASGQPAPVVSGDGHGGSLITSGGAMPCFARGTNLLTPDGWRPVETLRPGDALVTLGGVPRRIVWIGWRCIDLATDPDVDLLRPVVIAPGAFGPGRPRRALAISPLHAVFASDVLVPAALLVNGATVVRDGSGFAVTYYHVELDRHEIVLAEGLPVETYRDNANRARFAGALGTPGGYLPACADLVSGGARLRDIRAGLHRRALALGHRIIHDPGFAAGTGSQTVASRRFGSRMILDLPRPAARVILRAACAVPAETDPASGDRRRLGVCLGRVRADGRLAVAEPGAGWHERASGDRGRWSMESAELLLPRPVLRVSVEILGSVPRWRRDTARPAI